MPDQASSSVKVKKSTVNDSKHHCWCKKPFGPTCMAKGHKVPCEKHNENYNPRDGCVKCNAEEKRRILAERKAKEEAAKAAKAEEEAFWGKGKNKDKGKKGDKKT